MKKSSVYPNFSGLFKHRPKAYSFINGSSKFPNITGTVCFYQSELGVIAEITGLPTSSEKCQSSILHFIYMRAVSVPGIQRAKRLLAE